MPTQNHRRWYVGVGAALALLVWNVQRHWFLCDDAAISWRYVRNLKDGVGPVWNVGEAVEGYTNFAWIVELAALWKLTGLPPEVTAPVLSSILTVATFVLTVRWARQTDLGGWAGPGMMLAAVLVATNRTLAIWATGGLATRQFTVLLLLGAWLLVQSHRRDQHRLALWGAAVLGLAELTRPEALMIGPLMLAWWLAEALRMRRYRWMQRLVVGLPFGAIVLAHLAWRYVTYGDLLPNTYYAKSVGTWWTMGANYWLVASIEHGLWLMVPMALWGTWRRWRRGNDTSLMIGWVWMVPQALHLARMGGDHFEWRMLDPFFPFLIVAAVDGVGDVVRDVRTRRGDRFGAMAGVLGAAALVFYGGVVGEAHDREALPRTTRKSTHGLWVKMTPKVAPLATRVPPVAWMMPTYNHWGRVLTGHASATRHMEHANFWKMMRAGFEPYAALQDNLPEGIVDSQSSIGAIGYYMWSVPIIDTNGLTDAVVARNPVPEGARRKMAHDRSPPEGYLKARGVNVHLHFAETSLERAMDRAAYAVQLSDTVWLPFDIRNDADPDALFPEHTVHHRAKQVNASPVPERVEHEGITYEVVRWVGQFDGEDEGWTFSGGAFRSGPVTGQVGHQRRVHGFEGTGLLNSYTEDKQDGSRGLARSPVFTLDSPEERVTFLVGGGSTGKVGVRLISNVKDPPLGVWKGSDSERLTRIVTEVPVGQDVTVEVFDRSTGPWAHVLADGFAVVRPVGQVNGEGNASWQATQ
ncbi:MAG: hypothetical protein ACON4N_08345 [Myxococcota bacterium]